MKWILLVVFIVNDNTFETVQEVYPTLESCKAQIEPIKEDTKLVNKYAFPIEVQSAQCIQVNENETTSRK